MRTVVVGSGKSTLMRAAMLAMLAAGSSSVIVQRGDFMDGSRGNNPRVITIDEASTTPHRHRHRGKRRRRW